MASKTKKPMKPEPRDPPVMRPGDRAKFEFVDYVMTVGRHYGIICVQGNGFHHTIRVDADGKLDVVFCESEISVNPRACNAIEMAPLNPR